jgi:hypothetical protein
MIKFKKYLNDNFKLGKGAYGDVYRVPKDGEDEGGTWCALKQQHQDNFEDFSKVFIETSFHLFFPIEIPLIPLVDMFV